MFQRYTGRTRRNSILVSVAAMAVVPGGCRGPRTAGAPEPAPDARRAHGPIGHGGASSARAIQTPEFSPESYLAHVYLLASDELGGRGVGTEGIARATRYVADQFAYVALEPAGENGTYFQTFEIKTGAKRTDDGEFVVEGIGSAPEPNHDYIPFSFSSAEAFEGDVVFAGYGIVNPDENHDDYAHTDVTGKVVLVFRHEPPGWADGEDEFTPHAQFSNKVYAARNRGAVALLIVNRRPGEGESDTLVRFTGGGQSTDYGLPAFHIGRDLAGEMLSAGGLEELDALQEKLDKNVLCSAPLQGVRVKGKAGIERTSAEVRNVIGILRGAGALAEEYVVIGAHHDHLGLQVPRRSFGAEKPAGTPEIHNGADDNASGTAGVIELARAFATARTTGHDRNRKERPKRSLLFITFTAEESGLIGSQHFVSHPAVPLDKVVAMINLDMIGRLSEDRNRVEIYGTGSADEFPAMVERLAKQAGLTVRTGASAVGPADHTPFYTRGVPALHFFSGLHRDYHRPADDAGKVNEQGAVRILGLVRNVVAEIAGAEVRPTYNRTAGKLKGSRSAYKVVMGIMPDFYDEGDVPGMEVEAVLEAGPAQAAGMQDHDRIIRIDGKAVNNIHDYMAALSDKNPGDAVEVVVKRNDKELTLTVTLASGR